jgi:hypothetical protein
MDDPGELGEWWLPESPDRKMPGWLRHSDREGSSLLLVGSLAEPFRSPGVYPRVLGQVGSQAVTCEDCFQGKLNGDLFGGLSSEVVEVNQVYRGAWFEPGEQPGGNGIRVEMPLLVEWVSPRSLTVSSHPASGPGAERLTIHARELDPISFVLPCGEVHLDQSLRTTGDGVTSRSVEQVLIARLETGEVVPAEDLLGDVSILSDAVSLASDRYVAMRSVQLLHPHIHLRSDSTARRPIEIVARWTPGSNEPLNRGRVVAEYSTIGQAGFQRLLDTVAAFRIPVRRVIVTRHQEGAFNSDRLINVCAAMEALDRGHSRGRRTFSQRIERCLDLAGQPAADLIGDKASWISWLKRRRDHVAHHLLPAERRDGLEDLVLAEMGYLVFVLTIFRLADLPPEVFDRISDGPWLVWLRGVLADALG